MIVIHPAWSARNEKAVNNHIGARIREQRILLGMSQLQLATIIGVTFQQVQKYEMGINRIGCRILVTIAEALDVGVATFYDGIGARPDEFHQGLRERLLLELARNFVEIRDPSFQDSLCDLARSLSEAQGAGKGKDRESGASAPRAEYFSS